MIVPHLCTSSHQAAPRLPCHALCLCNSHLYDTHTRSSSSAADNEARKRIHENLDKRLHEAIGRYLWYEQQLRDLGRVAVSFKKGIGNIYAFLHGINKSSNEDLAGLTELNMIEFLGQVEQEVFKLLKRFLKQHASPARAAVSTAGSWISAGRPGSSIASHRMSHDSLVRRVPVPTTTTTTLRDRPSVFACWLTMRPSLCPPPPWQFCRLSTRLQ